VYQLLATYDISSVMYNIALGLHIFKPDDMCTFILTYKYALMYTWLCGLFLGVWSGTIGLEGGLV
jgi:hypothetical protein